MTVVTQGQITLYSVFDGQDGVKGDKGDKGDTGAQGLQGIAGAKGADGITYYTWIKYADTPTTGMSDLPTGKAYMGIAYNKLTATESTNYNDYSWSLIKGDKGDTGERGLQGLQGAKGDQGIQGVKGADGLTAYTHIAYATNSTGTAGFSVSDPVGKTYIGMYVDHTATDSTDPTKYKWTLIKGADGAQGIQGQAGADGKTPYFHTAYANNSTGTIGFSTTDATGRTFIGTYTDFVSADSTDPTKYTWVLIKGDKGDKGDQGIQGLKGADGVQYYTWLKYADSPTTGMSDDPTGKSYIGLAYNKTTATESTNYADYQWALIKGAKGDQGIQGVKGADGVTTYTWIKYGTSSTGANMSDDPTGKTYIGIAYNKTTPTESTVATDYIWSLIKGDKGDKGDQGVQGIQGVAGKDGVTTYTWVKYATSSAGANMSDLPDGKTYIGLAYNKTTPTESTNAADYTWALIKGDKGDTGLTGSAGTNGKDGITYYTWLKYADTPTTGMSDSPTGKTYMGIAYNKTTATESTNYADYSWSLIKGDTGATGATGATGPKGDQGLQGIAGPKGADGQTTYTWVKYADDSVGNGMSDLPDGKRYLGLAMNKTTATESTNKADYNWSPLYDNVDVGGRNLMTGTDFASTTGWDKWGSIGRIISYKIDTAGDTPCLASETRDSAGTQLSVPVGTAIGLQSNGRKFKVKAGQQYTVSFKVATSELGDTLDYTYVMYTVAGGNRQQPTINVKNFPKENPIYSGATTFYYHVSFTFTADRDDDNAYLLIGGKTTRALDGTNGYAWIRVREVMVEKGNVKSAWQKAPEDVQSGIDGIIDGINSIANITMGGIFTGEFKANYSYNGVANNGEIQVVAPAGTIFTHPNGKEYPITANKEISTQLESVTPRDIEAYVMFVGSDKTRFTGLLTNSSYEFMLVRYESGLWQYDNNTTWVNFTPNENDCIVGKVKATAASTKIDSFAYYCDRNSATRTYIDPTKNTVAGWTIGQINGKPAINGDMLQKDTVLANKLAVGNFENLFTNGSGEYGNIGFDAHPQWSIVNSTTTAYSGSYHFKGLHGAASNSEFYDSNQIQVIAGEKYYMEGYFKLEKAGTAFNTRTLLARWIDKAGASTWTIMTGNLTNTWQKLAYEFTVPATAVKMQIGLSVAGGLAAGNATYADSLFCKRMLTGELIVDGSIKAAQIDVNNLVAQTAFINAVKATDISGDRIKGGKISGVTYESINASNPKIKAVIETNSFKSYGASDGTKQNYAEMKEGGLSVFQMAETGSPFGDLKAFVEPARFNAVVGSRSVALEPTELRFWVPNMTGIISYDVTPKNDSGYGLRLEALGGVHIKSNNNSKSALSFEAQGAMWFDGWANLWGDPYGAQDSTWSVKDGGGRVKLILPVGKDGTGSSDYYAHVGGHKFFHNGNLGVAVWTKGSEESLLQFGGNANFKYWKGGNYFECKNGSDSGFIQLYASAFNTASSLVWKENIKNYEESALDVIMSADIMTYQYKQEQPEPVEAMESGTTIEEKEGHTHVGVIAEYAPELVKSEDGRGVDSYAMTSLSWKAIQELVSQIQELKAEISQLKAPEETPSETPTN